MGGSHYSASVTHDMLDSHRRSGTDAFTYSYAVHSGAVARKASDLLDPKKKNTFDKITRESFDSAAHPDSVAVAFLFDCTGSMGDVPRAFLANLGRLMETIVKKGYIEHPHILIGAYGDATCDTVPVQIGQFEAGNEIDKTLTNIYLEAGGGGHNTESAELSLYFLQQTADMDCLKKRSKKAYLFVAGDELPYPMVKRSEVEQFLGMTIQGNIRFSALDPRKKELEHLEKLHGPSSGDLLESLREMFEIFWIMPAVGHHTDSAVIEPLQAMFGQNFLRLNKAEDICELVAATIGVAEGKDIFDIARDLTDAGMNPDAISRAKDALVPYATSRTMVKGAKVEGELVASGTADSVDRI